MTEIFRLLGKVNKKMAALKMGDQGSYRKALEIMIRVKVALKEVLELSE